ncbi:hypothetical protein LCGC14_2968160 [marine sediment metagenome]|uniref:Uncharacterized protein n=1 Tax=marine sediment metagenome TaxID=412755 RepID=A0A0F9A1F1_9ZZZZ
MDRETQAIANCVKALEPIKSDELALVRVLDYLADRMGISYRYAVPPKTRTQAKGVDYNAKVKE